MKRAAALLIVAALAACADEAEQTIRKDSTLARICPDKRVVLEYRGLFYTYVSGYLKPYAASTKLAETCGESKP